MSRDAVPAVRYVVRYVGRVQGVGFRMTSVRQARGLAIYGTVRNETDGTVRMEIEGSRASLDELLRRIRTVMDRYIEAVHVDERPPTGRADPFHVTD